MSPSIVIRLAMAALATAFVLPAQSEPGRPAQPRAGKQEAKADEKVQTRLAEVIAMLEEDDLTPEQRAEAKKKLKEIGDRLRKDAAAKVKPVAVLPMAEGMEIAGDGDHVIVKSKEGVYVVQPKLQPAREVEGFPAVISEPVEGRRVMVVAPDTAAPSVPAPARPPKAPKPPKFPTLAEVPAAPEAPPVPDLADPVAPMSVEGMPLPKPLPKPRPRVTRTRVVETHEQPVEVVEGLPLEIAVEEAQGQSELRWAKAQEALEEARAVAEVEGRRLKLRYRALDGARARLDEVRQSELDLAAPMHPDVVRARFEAARAQDQAEVSRVKAAEVRRLADAVRSARAERVPAEALPRLRELPLLSRSLDREAAKEAKSVFGRVAETRPAEAGDDEIRALIDEMRAEMRQIRALMQELRTRSDREEDAEEGVGAGGGKGASSGGGAGFGGPQSGAASVFGEAPKARRVRVLRGAAASGGEAGGGDPAPASSPSSASAGGR
ncbi:MAG: hypothetical protein MUC36_21720 [Planctomycetes bacterium]|jgi:hypothetical protein|nr:hypothetical protein [Planctomycetota bacterium]